MDKKKAKRDYMEYVVIKVVRILLILLLIGVSFITIKDYTTLHSKVETTQKKELTLTTPAAESLYSGVQINLLEAQKESLKVEIVTEPAVEEPIVEEPTPLTFVPIDCSMPLANQQWIYNHCKEVGVDFEVVMAIIKTESNFTENIISRTSDYGYMQININNHAWLTKTLGTTNYCEMKDNITAGTYILKTLMNQYSDYNLALMAYNMGGGGANKLWKQGIYSSNYSRKIMAQVEIYKNR